MKVSIIKNNEMQIWGSIWKPLHRDLCWNHKWLNGTVWTRSIAWATHLWLPWGLLCASDSPLARASSRLTFLAGRFCKWYLLHTQAVSTDCHLQSDLHSSQSEDGTQRKEALSRMGRYGAKQESAVRPACQHRRGHISHCRGSPRSRDGKSGGTWRRLLLLSDFLFWMIRMFTFASRVGQLHWYYKMELCFKKNREKEKDEATSNPRIGGRESEINLMWCWAQPAAAAMRPACNLELRGDQIHPR